MILSRVPTRVIEHWDWPLESRRLFRQSRCTADHRGRWALSFENLEEVKNMQPKNLISWKVWVLTVALQMVPAYAQAYLDETGEENYIPPIEIWLFSRICG